jgi:uncharacterized Zn finger protein
LKGCRVYGKVEGSSGEEYEISVSLEKLSEKDRKAVFSHLSKPDVSASLLNNELHPCFESACKNLVLNGFDSECSCPDYENPCKHIAALFYVLAEEVDKAPQMLFHLAGISGDDLLACAEGKVTKEKKAVKKKKAPVKKKAGKKKPVKKTGHR